MSVFAEKRRKAKKVIVSINRLEEAGGWENLFAKRNAPLELEIGFGRDPFLVDEAVRRPEANFIGMEYDRYRVLAFVKKAAAKSLSNLLAIHGDAFYCLPRMFRHRQITRTYIHFPDPWHKKRHQKHRLLDFYFLKLLFYHMTPGGELIIATDSEDYTAFIRAGLEAIRGITNKESPHPWVDRLPGHRMTKFEKLFRSQGKQIFYFRYAKGGAFDDAYAVEIEKIKQKLPLWMDKMPHVIYNQKLDLTHYVELFSPFEWRDHLALYKVMDVWTSTRHESLLLECLIVHDGHDWTFCIEKRRR